MAAPVSPEKILKELTALWVSLGKAESAGMLRACSMTLLIAADEEEESSVLGEMVAEIMHHPDFQRLEAAWRGLQYLLSQSDTGANLRVKVLNVSKKELLRDLRRAPGFDQSALFRKVYEEEFGVFGGAPFGALLGDYEFGKSGDDIELLEKVSQVAAEKQASASDATTYAAVVGVGCEPPTTVAIDAGEAGFQVTAKLPQTNIQCLAAQTYVVVFSAPDA